MDEHRNVRLIVINYKTPAATGSLVEKVMDLERGVTHATVLDNSPGHTAAHPRSFDKVLALGNVSFLSSPRNLGFAGGVNAAIAGSPPSDLYWLLNSDALPRPGALNSLLAAVEDGAHIVGSRLLGSDGRVQSDGGTNHVLYGLIRHRHSGRAAQGLGPAGVVSVPWVHGASVLITREAWLQLDGFDERFFLYFEETDLCYRARRLGMRVVLAEGSVVDHVGYGSSSQRSAVSDIYVSRNSILFLTKHRRGGPRVIALAFWFLSVLAVRVGRGQWDRARSHVVGARMATRNAYGQHTAHAARP